MRDKDVLDKLFGKTADQPKEVKPVAQPVSELATTNGCDELRELPISLLQDFPADKHPFRPYTKPKLEALKQDIIERGIIQPLIVRPLAGDQYEIISGHNRKTAAREVGYIVLPCIVRTLDDNEALLQMVSTNLQQRQDLLYSEKAFAYKIQLEAMKRQGSRTDLTSSQTGTRLRSDEIIAEQAGESRNQIQRYIRLTYLIPELLEKVDDKELKSAGYITSYHNRKYSEELGRVVYAVIPTCVNCLSGVSFLYHYPTAHPEGNQSRFIHGGGLNSNKWYWYLDNQSIRREKENIRHSDKRVNCPRGWDRVKLSVQRTILNS